MSDRGVLEEGICIEEEDDDFGTQQQQQKKNKKKKKKEKEVDNKDGYKRKMRRAKHLLLLPLEKFEKLYTRNKRRPPPPPFPYSEDRGKGCYLCFMQPKVPPDSPLRPNPDAKTSSYYDFLKSLIERNDFYFPECNVHRDIRRIPREK